MAIDRQTIERVKEEARIEEVVGGFVELKRNGSAFKGLCPFHNEKTPSFIVTPSKHRYKCFGCGESGDVIGFVMKYLGLGFTDAVVWLAKKYNIPVEEKAQTQEDIEYQRKREATLQIMQWATDWLVEQAEAHQDSVLPFLINKVGITESQMRDYSLGFWPLSEHSDCFLSALKEKGFDLALAEELGLLRREEETLCDAFPGHILFPLRNNSHNTVTLLPMTMDGVHRMVQMPASAVYRPLSSFYGVYELSRQRMTQTRIVVRSVEEKLLLQQCCPDTNVISTNGYNITSHFLRHLQDDVRLVLFYPETPEGVEALMKDLAAILATKVGVKVVFAPEASVADYLRRSPADEVSDFLESHVMSFYKAVAQLYQERGVEECVEHFVPLLRAVADEQKRSMYVNSICRLLEVPATDIVNRLAQNR